MQFVLNYEEGGENSCCTATPASETFLSEIVGAQPYPRAPHEDGVDLRVRLARRRLAHAAPVRAAQAAADGLRRGDGARAQSRGWSAAIVEPGHEIASHGWRWINYQHVDEATEREHMRTRVEILRALTGERAARLVHRPRQPEHAPAGRRARRLPLRRRRLQRRPALLDRRRKSDGADAPQLVVPYTLDANDMRFATPQGFNTGEQFFDLPARTRSTCSTPRAPSAPKMMSVGLHCRLLGRPGRFAALQRFLDHVESHDRVWICRRVDIARHWIARHPFAH